MGYEHRLKRRPMPKRKRSAASTKAIMFKKPTARNQQEQIAALAEKTRENSRKLATQLYTVHHFHRIRGDIASSATAPFVSVPINNLSALTQIFGDPSESLGGKYTGRGITFDFNIVPADNMTQIDMTAFIIRPRNQKVALDANLAGSNSLALADGTDYVTNDGICYMNKKRWHVDAHYKMSTLPLQTQQAAPPGVWQGSMKVIKRKYTGKNVLKINNRVGTWNTGLDWSVNASQRQFLVVFHDNLGTPIPSLAPKLEGQILLTAHTSE